MKVSLDHIITLLNQSKEDWMRIDDDDCLHRYFDKYYILLCHWYDPDINSDVIYIEVDNMKEAIENVIIGTYLKKSNEYRKLIDLYLKAKERAIPAQRIETP